MGRETEIFNRTIKLDALYLEWKKAYEDGGTRPRWTDGKELNFIRSKIEWYQQELIADGYMDIVEGRELPPVMDETYMRHAEELLTQAKKTLAIYLGNEDYKYLVDYVPFLSEPELHCLKKKPEKILDAVARFADAVDQKRLVDCRRFFDTDKYLAEFKSAREELEINIEGLIPF